MANVPYDSGVPSTAPDTRVPDDFQRVDAAPSSFGAALAQGAQQAGAGATRAGNFFGEVAADNGANQFQDFTTKLLHGDPNKQVQQPDGTMGPDTGYLGLHGRAALDARPSMEQQIDAQLKSIRAGLSTPEQQLQFDNFSKRYRAGVSNQIGQHADTQATSWYQTVNDDSASLALQNVAVHADNPEESKHATADLINARLKSAQLLGAKPGDAVWLETAAKARQEALRAQLETIGVKDPLRAQTILEDPKVKAIAGTEYEVLSNQLRARTAQATGYAAVDGVSGQPGLIAKAHAGAGYANPTLPAFAQAAAEGGMSPTGMARTVQIESSGNPNAGRGTSHVGLVQAGSSYWSRYGQGSPFDPQQAIAALGRSTASDRSFLRIKLGREPTDAELYIAHQQGPGGAEKLFLFPGARAGDLVGDKQVRANGGNPDGTAAQFVGLWTAKFNGTSPHAFAGDGRTMTMPASVSGAQPTAPAPAAPDEPLPTFAQTPTLASFDQPAAAPPAAPAAPAAPTPDASARTVENIPQPVNLKADVFAQINAMETAGEATVNGKVVPFSHEAAQHARVYAQQQLEAQAIASEQDTRARRAQSESAVDNYNRHMMAGDFSGLQQAIINDPRLTGEARWSLYEHLQHVAGTSAGLRDRKEYGDAYFDLLRRVTAPSSDPSRIDDPSSLVSHLTPHGDLTTAGYEKIMSIAKQSARSVDDAAVNRTKSSMLSYANEKLTYSIPSPAPGLIPEKRDPKGTMLFNSEFVPRLEAAYDAYIKAGHNPWDANSPLAKKNVDALIEQIRPQRQMAQDQLTDPGALHDPNARPVAPSSSPSDGLLPPPPRGVNWNGWIQVVSRPPMSVTGQSWTHTQWAKSINRLIAEPTPRMIRFFDQKFGRAGYSGNEVLQALQLPRRADPVLPAAAPSAPPPLPPAGAQTAEMMGP